MLSEFKKLLGDLHYSLNSRDHALVNYLLPNEKREVIASYAGKYSILVETGTYLGETAAVMATYYSKIYTVELLEKFYEKAKSRFTENSSIHCYQGDSAEVIEEILASFVEPAVFWLDAHYSGIGTAKHSQYNSPIEQELAIIFEHNRKDHTILIDDARLFIGRDSYPTLSKLRKFVTNNSDYGLTVRDDIIRLIYDPEW